MENKIKQLLQETDLKELAQQLRKPQGELARTVAERMNEGNAAMNLHTLAVLNALPNDQILEIGMGNGFFVRNILSLDPSIKYVGCDYSEQMLAQAKTMNASFVEEGRASFQLGNIASLPFEDASFNKAFTINTIYFWEEPKDVIKELGRVLKHEGELILSLRPKDNMLKFPVTQYDFKFFSQQDVLELLTENGFDTIEVTHLFEPEAEIMDQQLVKECLIIKGIKQ